MTECTELGARSLDGWCRPVHLTERWLNTQARVIKRQQRLAAVLHRLRSVGRGDPCQVARNRLSISSLAPLRSCLPSPKCNQRRLHCTTGLTTFLLSRRTAGSRSFSFLPRPQSPLHHHYTAHLLTPSLLPRCWPFDQSLPLRGANSSLGLPAQPSPCPCM